MANDKHLPVRTIAIQFCVAEKTVRKLAREGVVPSVRIGGRYRIDPEAVKLALSSRRTPRS